MSVTASGSGGGGAVTGWIALGVGLLALVLWAAWPALGPQVGGPPDSLATLDADAAERLRRAAVLLGAGNRLEQLARDDTRLERAEALIDEVLESHPNLSEAHRLDGLLALAREDLDAARASLERAVALDPDSLEAFLALGASHAVVEDHAAAEAVFRRALDKHPDSIAALDNLGQTLWLLGREEEALEVYRRKIEIQQRDGYAKEPMPDLGGVPGQRSDG